MILNAWNVIVKQKLHTSLIQFLMTKAKDLHDGVYLDFVKQFAEYGKVFEVSTEKRNVF